MKKESKPRSPKVRPRAVGAEDRREKRVHLLLAARRLFLEKDFEDVTMDAVAKKAGVAKGTLYLYFTTKEELCLELNLEDYRDWFAELRGFLGTAEGPLAAGRFCDWLLPSLRKRPLFVRFVALVPTLFEKNIGVEAARTYKRGLRAEMDATLPALRAAIGCRSDEEGLLFFIQLHAVISGLWSHAWPAPVVRKIFLEPEFRSHVVDFEVALRATMEKLLAR